MPLTGALLQAATQKAGFWSLSGAHLLGAPSILTSMDTGVWDGYARLGILHD